MAVIRQITAQQGLDSGAGSRPSTRVDDSVGQGVRQFGGSVQSLGNELSAIDLRRQQMKMQMEEFRTEQSFVRFKDDFAADFANLEVNMDPSGEGFAENVSSGFNVKAEGFLKTVPDALKPKFAELVATSRETWINQAAAKEADQRTSWYRKGIEDSQNRLATQVFENPEVYRAALDEGYRTIEASGLPEQEKQALRENWGGVLDAARAENMLRTSPEKLAGIDPGNSNAARLVKAVISTESSGNPQAESAVGASGLMQVMPDTAREIAAELRDPNFPANGTDAQVKTYLKNANVSVRYGSHYIAKQLRAYNGDVEAALVAYNAGPAVADKWLNSGRDDSILPTETADYKRKVARAYANTNSSQVPERNIELKPAQGVNLSGVDPVVLSRWQQVQNIFGAQVAIKSGFRDPVHNQRVGGAKRSQHIHGAALDLDVAGMPKEKRLELIRLASANGFTGIGVYDNTIHLDIGPRRAWGPSYKFDSVPSWASEAISEHMQGKAAPIAATQGGQQGTIFLSPDTANMPLDKRIAYYDKAVSAMNAQKAAEDAANAATYNKYKDAVTLGIETGDVTSEAQILSDQTLDDGDKATLLKRYREASKETQATAAIIGAITEGRPVNLNPFDTDQKSAGNKAFEKMLSSVGPEDANAVADAYIKATGHVPDKVVAGIRNGLSSRDATKVADAMQSAANLRTVAGPSLGAVSNGDEIDKAGLSFDHYVNGLGYTAQEAAQKYIDLNDPDKRKAREALLDSKPVQSALKDVTAADVRDIWDTFGPNRFTGYDVGANPSAQAAIVADYKDILSESIVDANGDMELAKTLASERFKRNYGPSEMTLQSGIITRLPPETTYPPDINGSHAYVKDQAIQALKEQGIEASDVFLQTYDGTEEDVRAGRPPRYMVYYRKQGEAGDTLEQFSLPFYAIPGSPDFSANKARLEANKVRDQAKMNVPDAGPPEQRGIGMLPPANFQPLNGSVLVPADFGQQIQDALSQITNVDPNDPASLDLAKRINGMNQTILDRTGQALKLNPAQQDAMTEIFRADMRRRDTNTGGGGGF